MSEKKQISHKDLIVLMFVLQLETIHTVCYWYIPWLGFIYYGNVPDQPLDAFEVYAVLSLSLHVVASTAALLAILTRLAIADSIMVSGRPSARANTTDSLQLERLEVLDHMEQELGGSDHPSDPRSCVYRYARMALGDKGADKHCQHLG
jgi:hypothetical protein